VAYLASQSASNTIFVKSTNNIGAEQENKAADPPRRVQPDAMENRRQLTWGR
jgi:hypothetical protein